MRWLNWLALLAAIFVFLGSRTRAAAVISHVYASADSTLIEPFPTNNLGGANVILAGVGENLQRHRALLRFDVVSQLPVGTKVRSASLTLELAGLPNNGYAISAMGLHRVLRPWGEGDNLPPTACNSCTGQGTLAGLNEVTWVDRFALTTNTWFLSGGAAGVDFVAAPSGGQTIYKFADSPYSFLGPEMGSDVQLWLDHPELNFGWMLFPVDESSPFTARRFYSREQPEFQPYVTVDYIVAPTLEGTQRIGSQFTFSFVAQAGQNYTIEFRDNLSTAPWQTFASVPPVTEPTRVVVTDPFSPIQRFYRVTTR